MKQKTKVNPYEKKKVVKKKLTRKHWTVIGILLGVVAIFVALVIFGPKHNPNSGADAHAGHNHAEGEECGTGTTAGGHSANDGHNHGATTANGALNYRVYTNADKTYTLSVVDANNKELFKQDNLVNAPLKDEVTDDIFSLGWATGTGPNDFVHIFCNNKTGAVSREFVAPRGFDGVRIAYPNEDQTKIIVENIFNDKYHKEYDLENAHSKNGDVIVGGKLRTDKKTVLVTYYGDDEGNTVQSLIQLYA